MRGNSIDRDVNNIKKDLTKLRGDIGALARSVEHRGLEEVDHAKDAVLETLASGVESVRRHGHEAEQAVAKGVQARPLTSLVIAFGAGILAGRLLLR